MDERIVKDIKRVAVAMGLCSGDSFSLPEYLMNGGKYTEYSIHDGGSTWFAHCSAAGFATKAVKKVTNNEYFKNLNKAYQTLGRFPKSTELKKFGLLGAKKRWSPIKSFFDEAVKNGKIDGLSVKNISSILEKKGDQLVRTLVERKETIQSEETRPYPAIPRSNKRKKWQRTKVFGFPYAPQEETGLIALFAILCSRRVINWQILDLTSKGIDAICYIESERKEIMVEFKNILSKAGWNHSFDDLDYLVCWENRWEDFPKPVIEVKKLIANLEY